MTADPITTAIVAQIDRLQTERRAIDDKIAALELAYETLVPGGANGTNGHAKPSRKRPARRTRDVDGVDKTLAFLRERTSATSIAQVARHFRCTRPAAMQRLVELLRRGVVERV